MADIKDKTEKNMKKVSGEDLKDVNGGSYDQTNEIKQFIRDHDRSHSIRSDEDVVRWLERYSGIEFESITLDKYYYNEYILKDGRTLSQDQLMWMLMQNYGDLPV